MVSGDCSSSSSSSNSAICTNKPRRAQLLYLPLCVVSDIRLAAGQQQGLTSVRSNETSHYCRIASRGRFPVNTLSKVYPRLGRPNSAAHGYRLCRAFDMIAVFHDSTRPESRTRLATSVGYQLLRLAIFLPASNVPDCDRVLAAPAAQHHLRSTPRLGSGRWATRGGQSLWRTRNHKRNATFKRRLCSL